MNKLKWSDILLFITYFFGINYLLLMIVRLVDLTFKVHIATDVTAGYLGLIFDALAFLIVLMTYKKVQRFALQKLNPSVFRMKRTYLFVFLGFLLFIISQYFLIGIFGVDKTANQSNSLGISEVTDLWQKILLFISLVVLTPIKEEILYRGIIYGFLESKYNFGVGLIISSGIFGLLHFGYPISAIIMGLAFALIYKLTNSLLVPILLHILWNLYVVMLIF